jgi:ribose transport system permease protein
MKKEVGLLAFLVMLSLVVVGVQIKRQLDNGASLSELKTPQFITARNLSNTANIVGQYGVFSIGVGLIIITGGIDLSIGSMCALAGVMLSIALTRWNWPWPVAALSVILVTMLLGYAHGLLVTRMSLQPFIVTLCGLLLYRGIARFIADDATQGFGSASDFTALRFLASGHLAGIPMTFILLIVIAAIAWVALHRSVYGRYLLAVGRNEEAARFSGINTRRIITSAYVIGAMLTGIAAIMIALYTNQVTPSLHGNFYELWGIAAAVLGGCSLRGGEGSIIGIILGTMILQVLPNVVILLGIPSSLDFAVLGAVLLIGVLADELLKRRARRKLMQQRQ